MSPLRLLPCVAIACACLPVILSCSKDNKVETVDDIADTRHYPTMLTTNVSTYVSDSGYTRYHITAPRWVMYEEADTPYWSFPEGLFLEKYDNNMQQAATFRADSATFLSQMKVWRFDGNVRMLNVNGDKFATPQLFWDQNARKVYSDSFMHIERTERIIEGYGFESNESMTEYSVMHPQMILPIDRMRRERDSAATAPTSTPPPSAAPSAPSIAPPPSAAPNAPAPAAGVSRRSNDADPTVSRRRIDSNTLKPIKR